MTFERASTEPFLDRPRTPNAFPRFSGDSLMRTFARLAATLTIMISAVASAQTPDFHDLCLLQVRQGSRSIQ